MLALDSRNRFLGGCMRSVDGPALILFILCFIIKGEDFVPVLIFDAAGDDDTFN